MLTLSAAAECVSDHGKAACTDLGGECMTERDGYYIVSAICLVLGTLGLIFHMIPTARKLQGRSRLVEYLCNTEALGLGVPPSRWRVS